MTKLNPKMREVSKIGYSHIRIAGKIYQVVGYERKQLKSGTKIDKKFIQLQQILEWRDEWVDTIAPSFRSQVDREWRVWHEHEFRMGSLLHCKLNETPNGVDKIQAA